MAIAREEATENQGAVDAPKEENVKPQSIVQPEAPASIEARRTKRRGEKAREIVAAPPEPPTVERISDEEQRELIEAQQMVAQANAMLEQVRERATKQQGAYEYVVGRLLRKYRVGPQGGIAPDGTIIRG